MVITKSPTQGQLTKKRKNLYVINLGAKNVDGFGLISTLESDVGSS